MKNEKLYEEWRIQGYPNHFFTVEAMDMYDNWVYRQCQRLPEGTEDFPRLTRIKRQMYIFYFLNGVDCLFDAINSLKEWMNECRKKGKGKNHEQVGNM